MIATSVNTKTFTEILETPRFLVEPPPGNLPFSGDAVEIVPGRGSARFSLVEKVQETAIPSVEKTLDEMIERCRRQVLAYPNSSRSKVNLALALFNRGQVEEGVKELQEVLELDGGDFSALSLLAAARFQLYQFDDAEVLFNRIVKLHPQNPAAYIGLASVSLRKADYESAARWLADAVSLELSPGSACYLLSMVHLKLNRPHKAISVLRKAIRKNERSAELHQGLAVAFLVARDFEQAERYFKTALAIHPQFKAAIHGLALLYLQCKRSDDVISLLTQHLELSPDDRQGREELARAYVDSGQYRQARSQLRELMSVKEPSGGPNIAEVGRIANNIGVCYALEGRLLQAEELVLHAIEVSKANSVIPYENLTRIYCSRGNFDHALNAIADATRNGLYSSDLALLREVCLVNVGRHEDAISVLKEMIGNGSSPVQAYADLGWLLSDWREDYDAAIEVLNEGIERAGQNPMLLNNLGYALLMKGDPKKARLVLDKLSLDTENLIYPAATKGLLLIMEGDLASGEREYKKAENIAAQQGNRNLMLSIREKKYLELAKASIRLDDIERARDFVELGSGVAEHETIYRFRSQLNELKERLTISYPRRQDS